MQPSAGRPGRPGRPDRIALWAVFLALAAVASAATSARAYPTGGAPAPAAEGDWVEAELGQRVLSEGMRGSDVRTLQELLRAKRFGPPHADGVFATGTAAALRAFQRAAGLAPDGVAGPPTLAGLVRHMRLGRATWYGPGFYGNRTACGRRLRRDTVGVAHPSLPCGTRVTFYHRGRFLTAPVIDRGPFHDRSAWDLTEAAARWLGFTRSGSIRALHHRSGAARRSRLDRR